MIDPMKLADRVAAWTLRSDISPSMVSTQEIETIVSALRAMAQPDTRPAEPADDGMKDDLDSALDVLIRRINGDAPLSTAAEWVRRNYPGRAKDLRPAEPASGDVRERIAMHLAGNVSAKQMAANPKEARRARRAADEVLELLYPGDRVGGCVLVPAEPTAAMQYAGLKALDQGGLADCNCDQNDVYAAMLAAIPEAPDAD